MNDKPFVKGEESLARTIFFLYNEEVTETTKTVHSFVFVCGDMSDKGIECRYLDCVYTQTQS